MCVTAAVGNIMRRHARRIGFSPPARSQRHEGRGNLGFFFQAKQYEASSADKPVFTQLQTKLVNQLDGSEIIHASLNNI